MSRHEAQELLSNLGIHEEAINSELSSSSQLSFIASCAAVDAKKELRQFEGGAYAAYQSHIRRYVRFYMLFHGEKDTIRNTDDACIRLFGVANQDDYKLYAIDVADYLLTKEIGKSEALKQKVDAADVYVAYAKKTYVDMYKYMFQELQVHYDGIESIKLELESVYEKAEALARSYEKRSHCLVAIAANLRAAGDIDAYSAHPFVSDVLVNMKQAIVNNPTIDNQTLTDIAETSWRKARNDKR